MKKADSTNKAGKRGSKGGKTPSKSFRLQAKVYFLTYRGITDSGEKITKSELAKYLLKGNPNDRKVLPTKYLVCEQMYGSGQPHFHAILIYPRRKQIISQDFYDYRGIHPNIQTMRNMKAALQYVHKQDTGPETNMGVLQQTRVARAKETNSLYQFLEQQMMKDPHNFDPYKFCFDHNLTRQICKANYSKAMQLLKKSQQAYCNKLMAQKPGFRIIDRSLIQQKLTPSELETYGSWRGYGTIVKHLNQMNTERGRRQQKSLNLLITGPPSIGKSALVWQRNPLPGRSSIVTHCAVYPMGMKGWFPDYKSDVYACIFWNEAKLTSYSYEIVLQLLDGNPTMLPAKGGGHKKVDNPLIIMTSNMTLDQMVVQKFSYSKAYQGMARKNLAVRVENVIVPQGYDLFLLQKLLVPVASD